MKKVYQKFPEWIGTRGTPSQWKLWQWMYGMQATYGFRNHEVFNAFNLTEKYLGDDGSWHYPYIDPVSNPRGTIYTEGNF